MDHDAITNLMRQTAASLGRSLSVYWPSDTGGRNDPNERNLSIHFAHVLLANDFAVFAEAHFPAACFAADANWLDILGIANDGTFFLACEFKKHGKGAAMSASAWDVDRILKFDLPRGLCEPKWSKARVEISATCKRGIGVVAGLRWTQTGKAMDLPKLQASRFGQRIVSIGGIVGEPVAVPKKHALSPGAYFLQFAHFPIPGDSVEATPG